MHADSRPPQLRVLTWNVHAFAGCDGTPAFFRLALSPHRRHLDCVAEQIWHERADVVCLNEFAHIGMLNPVRGCRGTGTLDVLLRNLNRREKEVGSGLAWWGRFSPTNRHSPT